VLQKYIYMRHWKNHANAMQREGITQDIDWQTFKSQASARRILEPPMQLCHQTQQLCMFDFYRRPTFTDSNNMMVIPMTPGDLTAFIPAQHTVNHLDLSLLFFATYVHDSSMKTLCSIFNHAREDKAKRVAKRVKLSRTYPAFCG
jgi:hypothetical protein